MTTTTATKTDDLVTRITDTIIRSIEEGQATGAWVKPWAAIDIPTNASTGKAYRGVNVLWFWMTAADNGWSSNMWATYKQWQALGAQVRKGEKGTGGIKWVATACKDHGPEESCTRCGRIFPTVFTVFNAEQVDGYEHPVSTGLSDEQRLDEAERFFERVGADVKHGGDRAFYSPSLDHIAVPRFADFSSPAAYYATVGHEMTHWTGAKKRLDRDLSGRFGSDSYAVEELVAELGAAMLCAHLGISDTPRPDHAEYLAAWLKILKADPRALITAASKAATAVEFLVNAAS